MSLRWLMTLLLIRATTAFPEAMASPLTISDAIRMLKGDVPLPLVLRLLKTSGTELRKFEEKDLRAAALSLFEQRLASEDALVTNALESCRKLGDKIALANLAAWKLLAASWISAAARHVMDDGPVPKPVPRAPPGCEKALEAKEAKLREDCDRRFSVAKRVVREAIVKCRTARDEPGIRAHQAWLDYVFNTEARRKSMLFQGSCRLDLPRPCKTAIDAKKEREWWRSIERLVRPYEDELDHARRMPTRSCFQMMIMAVRETKTILGLPPHILAARVAAYLVAHSTATSASLAIVMDGLVDRLRNCLALSVRATRLLVKHVLKRPHISELDN